MPDCTEVQTIKEKVCKATDAKATDAKAKKNCARWTAEVSNCHNLVELESLLAKGGGRRKSSRKKASRKKVSRKKSSRKRTASRKRKPRRRVI